MTKKNKHTVSAVASILLTISCVFSYAQSSRALNTFEVFGDSLFEGKWDDRGADNVVSSVFLSNFVSVDSSFNFITTSGYIYSKKESNSEWTLVNPTNKFNEVIGFSKFIKNGTTYLNVAQKNGAVYHSSDNGKTWKLSTGLNVGFTSINKLITAPNGDLFMLMEEKDIDTFLGLFKSNDNGKSFTKAKQFKPLFPLPFITYDIANIHGLDSSIAVMYYDTLALYNLYTDSLHQISKVQTFGYREAGICGVINSSDTVLYLNRGGTIHSYDQNSNSWNQKSLISFEPLNPYSFDCDAQNSATLFLGSEVLYKSSDSGATWAPQNSVSDFYNDRTKFLHRNINAAYSASNHNGQSFQLLSTDGGMYVSQDKLTSVINLTTSKIRNATYMDIEVLKNQSEIIAADDFQGLQYFNKWNSDSSINSDFVSTGSYQKISANNGSSYWASSKKNVGFVLTKNNLYLEEKWNYSDSLTRGNTIVPIQTIPGIGTKVLVGGMYTTGDVDKKDYLYEAEYKNGGLVLKKGTYNFNLSPAKDEFVSAISVSSHDTNHRYVLTSKGNFYFSVDAGKVWRRSAFFNELSAHDRYGAVIYASKTTSGKVYAAGIGSGNGCIFVSTNQGKDFVKIGDGMVGNEVYDLETANEDSLIFAATKNGPYVFDIQSQEWISVITTGLPSAEFNCLSLVPNAQQVLFGSYGQGMYAFNYQYFSDTIIDYLIDFPEVSNVELFPNPVKDQLNLKNLEKNAKIFIGTVDGKLIETPELRNSDTNTVSLRTEEIQPGIYILGIQTENQTNHFRFIKE